MRTILEEEKALVEELDGYREYLQRVRYRWAPHVVADSGRTGEFSFAAEPARSKVTAWPQTRDLPWTGHGDVRALFGMR